MNRVPAPGESPTYWKGGSLKIAYVVSRFPKLSETFVVSELREQVRLGADVEVYPLLRQGEGVVDPDAEYILPRVCFTPLFSWAVVKANFRCFLRQPRLYVSSFIEAITGAIRSARFLAGAVIYFPKSVFIAQQMELAHIEHIHAHFASHPALTALIVHRLTGISFSFTAHGSDIHRDQCLLDKKLSACAFTVTVSNYNKNFITQRCGASLSGKIRVIHCGIAPELFRVRQHGRGEESVRIVCVGRLHPVKGHRWLIEACALLRRRGIRFECHLVGDGPERASLQRQVQRQGLEQWVRLVGCCSPPDVRSLLAISDIAVLASTPIATGEREGIPVTLMEAMASGVPVVATNISGIPELVEDGENGLLVFPCNPVALADAIQRLCLDSELRAQLGRAGRARVTRDFNLHLSGLQLRDLFFAQAKAKPELRSLATD